MEKFITDVRIQSMRKTLISLFLLCLGMAQAAGVYTVKSGDTLSSISKKTNVSIETLVKLNNLSSSTLSIGQKIKLGNASTGSTQSKSQTAQKPAGNSKVKVIAASWRGAPYVYGGVSRRGVDCSGFTMQVMREMGVSLPHSSAGQFRYGTPVAKSSLREGDLVFFNTTGRGISHVGVYLGSGQFIHASTPRTGVIVSNINEAYYRNTYVGARRVLGN